MERAIARTDTSTLPVRQTSSSPSRFNEFVHRERTDDQKKMWMILFILLAIGLIALAFSGPLRKLAKKDLVKARQKGRTQRTQARRCTKSDRRAIRRATRKGDKATLKMLLDARKQCSASQKDDEDEKDDES